VSSRSPASRHSLSRRVLGLTLIVMLLTEAMLFVAVITRERRDWLDQRILAAQIAARALPPAPGGFAAVAMDRAVREDLLRLAGVVAVRVQEPGRPMVVLGQTQATALLDLRRETALGGVVGSVEALLRSGDRLLLVMASSPKQPSSVLSVVLHDRALGTYLRVQARGIALSGLAVAAVTGGLVYSLLLLLLVRPMRRITGSIVAFRADPERTPPLDPRQITPLAGDEMALAGQELAAMQRELRAALWRNARLAALGTAVAKVSHDIRGALSPALLAAERLQANADPAVRRAGDLVARTVERATELVRHTLDFAREVPAPPERVRLRLHALVEETADQARAVNPAIVIDNAVPDGLVILADRSGITRVLGNLMRNAAQAGANRLRIAATLGNAVQTIDHVAISIADDGPGLPEAVRHDLFRPFVNGGRPGGTGLGLAITRDLVRAQGGDVTLVQSGPTGTEFRIALPLQADGRLTQGVTREVADAAGPAV